MTTYIEVELRGPLDKELHGQSMTTREFESILKREKCTTVRQENRLLIDYSTPLEGISDRKLDVRIRTTNGVVQIVVKKGSMTALGREEASVTLADGELERAIHALSLLGYGRGVACDRGITRYQIGEIEVAIQEVRYFENPTRTHSRFYEIEILTNDEGRDSARAKLLKWLACRGVPVYQDDEWNEYVEQMNREANGFCTYGVDSLSVLHRYSSTK